MHVLSIVCSYMYMYMYVYNYVKDVEKWGVISCVKLTPDSWLCGYYSYFACVTHRQSGGEVGKDMHMCSLLHHQFESCC